MWCEVGYDPDTFWHQTERSFANAIAGAARKSITQSWQVAAMTAAASVGKLKPLAEYLPAATVEADPYASQRSDNAKLLHALFKLKASGIPMRVEKIERLH